MPLKSQILFQDIKNLGCNVVLPHAYFAFQLKTDKNDEIYRTVCLLDFVQELFGATR